MSKKLYLLFLFISFFANAQDRLTVYFDTGKDVANGAEAQKLQQWITANKDVIVVSVYGYADTAGSEERNKTLSDRRINYVQMQLQTNGITFSGQVEVKAFGESLAQSEPDDEDRKVVVSFVKPEVVAPIPERVEAVGPKAAPKLAAEIATSKKGDKLRLRNLNFIGGKDEVLPSSEAVLKELLQAMKDNTDLKIDIQGHICCYQKDQNDLSEARAKAVYKYLKDNGISKSRMSYRGFGGSRPMYPMPEKNENQREANRRVEIEIMGN